MSEKPCDRCGQLFVVLPRRIRFCSKRCAAIRAGDDAEAFAALYVPEPTTGCWLWLGKSDALGYGRVKRAGKEWLAHRASYALHVGDPGELCCCHRCDTPACVNPSHIFLGTRGDNARDRVAKGRVLGSGSNSRSKTHCPQGHPYAGDNLFLNSKAGRICRICQRASSARCQAKKKEMLAHATR